MPDYDLYRLAPGVQLVEIAELSHFAKLRFEYEETDMVLTMPDSRITSKLIGKDAADFLRVFKEPRSWEEAIVDFACIYNIDPQQLAEEVFDLLTEMERTGYMIKMTDAEGPANCLQEYYKSGDIFNGYRLQQKWQALDDTEVFMAEDSDGINYALKLLVTSDSDNEGLFKTETAVLERLDGRFNPSLVEKGQTGTHYYLATEWFRGKTCDKYADQFRNYNVKENIIKLTDLCKHILAAYQHLHIQGVFHGDVNLRNILVSATGDIKIVDFALAVTDQSSGKASRPGVVFFYEPEYAKAVIEGKSRPPVTAKSEQYALAALLYYLLTGHYYIDFSIEKNIIFQQILTELPLPFESFDVNIPTGLNKVFAIALAKDPNDRFEDLGLFASAIDEACSGLNTSVDYFDTLIKPSSENFSAFVANKFSWQSSFLRNGLSFAPTCSVNYGAAGIAYMYYRMACVREAPELLQLADIWASHATDFHHKKEIAFFSKESGITKDTVGNRSIYHSATGAWLLQALISSCNDDTYNRNKALQQYLHFAKTDCNKTDLTLGKCSLLVGSSIIMTQLQQPDLNELIQIRSFTSGLLKEIWQETEKHPPIHIANKMEFYGIAHGWAGLLYASLLWCSVNNRELPGKFFDRVEQLLLCAQEQEDIICWPVSVRQSESRGGWCNGTAGYVFLWSLLFMYTGDEKYLVVARKSANHVYENAFSRNANLCCGMSGKAYAMLRLYNITKDATWLKKAKNIESMILQQIGSPLMRNNSLYKGEVGIAVLLAEINRPELAAMPFFEI